MKITMLWCRFPLLHPERHMIGFESDEEVLQKLRDRLRNMTDAELIQFGITVRGLGAVRQERRTRLSGNCWKHARSGSGGNVSPLSASYTRVVQFQAGRKQGMSE